MKPQSVIELQQSICRSAKCDQLEKLNFVDECASCPNGHWGRYRATGCDGLRLGDKVESIAQPIAKGLDKLLGTNIADCGGCQKRKEKLNKI